MHGVATTTIMLYFCEVGVPEIIVPMLLMEVSPSSACVIETKFHFSFFAGLLTKLLALRTFHFGVFLATTQISTINLGFMGAVDLLSKTTAILNILIFSLTFTYFRMIVCPYLWWGIWTETWEHRNNPISQACLPWHFTYVVFVFGEFAMPLTDNSVPTTNSYGREMYTDDAFIFPNILGMFFNCLNTFWYYKIIKKIIRKFSGTENWKTKNHVKDS